MLNTLASPRLRSFADGECVAVKMPAFAYPTRRRHGTGRRCARGFEALEARCVMIDLPENPHLDRTGNCWQFNQWFQISEGDRCMQTG